MAGKRRKPGRLGPYIDGFQAWLLERGYTHQPPFGVVEEEESLQLPTSWCAVSLAVPGCVELLLGEGVGGRHRPER